MGRWARRYRNAAIACRETGSAGLYRGNPDGCAVPVLIPVDAIHAIAGAVVADTGTSANDCDVGVDNDACAYRAKNNAIACRDTGSDGLNNGFPDGCGVPVLIPCAAIHSIAA